MDLGKWLLKYIRPALWYELQKTVCEMQIFLYELQKSVYLFPFPFTPT